MQTSLLKTVLLILFLICISLFGYTNTLSQVPFDGLGTEVSPYLLKSRDDIHLLADSVNAGSSNFLDKHYRLENDIIDPPVTKVIGIGYLNYCPHPFRGHFDGQGHIIHLAINEPTINYVGLFGAIYTGSTLKNIEVTGYVNGNGHVGGIAGETSNRNLKIINCINTAKITGYGTVGGICGRFLDGNIENCINTGTIEGYGTVGGICGYFGGNNGGSMINCTNYGLIKATGIAGGIWGNTSPSYYGTNVINNCVNFGIVIIGEGIENLERFGCLGYNSHQSTQMSKATITNCHYDKQLCGAKE